METMTEYVYKVGSIDEVSRCPDGSVDNLEDSIRAWRANQELLVPQFIGVYETKRALKDEEDKRFQELYRRLKDNASIGLQVRNISESIHHSLICIGCEEGLTPDVVRTFFRDPLRRVAIHQVTDIPDFQARLSEGLLEFLNAQFVEEGLSLKEIGRRFKREIGDIRKDRAIYGLTREDQLLLETYRQIDC